MKNRIEEAYRESSTQKSASTSAFFSYAEGFKDGALSEKKRISDKLKELFSINLEPGCVVEGSAKDELYKYLDEVQTRVVEEWIKEDL